MELIKSQTYQNLARAYAGECQALVRYKFVEYGARMKNMSTLAEIIDKIVYNEFNHARMLYTYIQKGSKQPIENISIEIGTPFRQKWDLKENLRLSAQDEKDEVEIYKAFSKVAKKEGFSDVENLFTLIGKVESCHQKLFNDLYTQMDSDTLFKKSKKVKWKCSKCGHEWSGLEAWDKCPLCEASKNDVMLIVDS